MRGKFVLAQHCEIYEPARLSSSVLTTDKTLEELDQMENITTNVVVCQLFFFNE